MKLLTKTIKLSRLATLGAAAALFTVVTPMAVSAHGSNGDWNGHDSQSVTQADSRGQSWWHDLQNCDQKQQNLNSRAINVKSADMKKLNGQNILYSGVQNYVSTNNLTVENYATLNGKVATDKTNATAAINAINAPQIDCSHKTFNAFRSNTKAMKDFEASIKSADSALKTYRHDLSGLLNAVLDS